MTALRLNREWLDLGHSSVLVDRSELGSVDLLAAGFRPLHDGRGEVPPVTDLGVDLSSRTDLDFIAGPESGGRMVGGYSFAGDPHAQAWWDDAHSRGSLVVVVTDDPAVFGTAPTIGEGFDALVRDSALIGNVPLVVKAYPGGIGTRP